jgi:hypothetical protein
VIGAGKKTVTQRVWEIRVETLLKLDRAARVEELAGAAVSQSE